MLGSIRGSLYSRKWKNIFDSDAGNRFKLFCAARQNAVLEAFSRLVSTVKLQYLQTQGGANSLY